MNSTLRTSITTLIAAVAILGCAAVASAQCGPQWNTALGSPGLNGRAACMQVWDDGKGGGPALYVGGDFTTANGFTMNGVARWNGSIWTSLGPVGNEGVSGGLFGPSVNAMTVWNDGTGAALYIAGDFDTAGGVLCNGVARWNGTSFEALPGPNGPGVAGIAYALAVHQDIAGPGIPPVLYIGGSFSVSGVTGSIGIVRWDGANFAALNGGLDNTVYTLASFVDSLNRPRLYVGGSFGTADNGSGQIIASHFAMWNGQANLWSQVGGGTDGWWVQAMKVWDDGSGPGLFIAGVFGNVGGNPANCIAKWHPSFGWFTLGNGLTGLNGWYTGGLQVFNDGSGEALYASAYFDNAGGNPAAKIARWDGGAWSTLATGLNSYGQGLGVYDPGYRGNPRLYVGGNFTTAGGQPSSHIAIWEPKINPTSCPADLTCDGTINGADMAIVLGSWGPCP